LAEEKQQRNFQDEKQNDIILTANVMDGSHDF
jgi:hypothetical protein